MDDPSKKPSPRFRQQVVRVRGQAPRVCRTASGGLAWQCRAGYRIPTRVARRPDKHQTNDQQPSLQVDYRYSSGAWRHRVQAKTARKAISTKARKLRNNVETQCKKQKGVVAITYYVHCRKVNRRVRYPMTACARIRTNIFTTSTGQQY